MHVVANVCMHVYEYVCMYVCSAVNMNVFTRIFVHGGQLLFAIRFEALRNLQQLHTTFLALALK